MLCNLITCYQRFVSPFLPPHCRYTPSCSQYMLEAIQKFGALKGSWLGVKRLARCNPFGSHGYDPVTDVGSESAEKRQKTSENR